MDQLTYVCATCEEYFTRKYSATRHNLTIHKNGEGEIITLLEYLVGRSSSRYQASHPSWYRRSKNLIHNFGHVTTTVADSVRDTFLRPGDLQQGQYQYHQQQEALSLLSRSKGGAAHVIHREGYLDRY